MTIDELFMHDAQVNYLTTSDDTFERAYVDARKKESRILSDEQVKKLPAISKTHEHFKEWRKRIPTTKKFTKYLSNRGTVAILEIGCGNGWFSSKMLLGNNRVIGLDVGSEELEQASQCFQNENLRFIYCNDLKLLPEESFDIIVFNASLQYFDLNDAFWKTLRTLLKEKGEIHILDSPIYTEKEAINAKERSRVYYSNLNVDLINYYHPVHWDQIPKPRKLLYKPMGYLQKILPYYSPFPWVCIYNS